MSRKRVVLLGSTGSIGRNALRVLSELSGRFRVVALAAATDDRTLSEQISRWSPERVALYDSEAAERLRGRVGGGGPEIVSGEEGILSLCGEGADYLFNAAVGAAGLRPTLEAIGRVERICLANKESLVAGGALVMGRAEAAGTEIVPVDSEHVALHQCLEGRERGHVRRLLLTASGGPFRGASEEDLHGVTVEAALSHPTWSMGKKITVDSATLMNKGLEVIEAMHLFQVPPGKIDVIVHPQSVVHSMVEFVDGSLLAQLGETEMRHPIRYALTYPDRAPWKGEYDLAAAGPLTFEKPDTERFPALALAYRAAREGGTAPAVLSAANEVAVEAFLSGGLSFAEIPSVVDQVLRGTKIDRAPGEEEIYSADREARRKARELLGRYAAGNAAPPREVDSC